MTIKLKYDIEDSILMDTQQFILPVVVFEMHSKNTEENKQHDACYAKFTSKHTKLIVENKIIDLSKFLNKASTNGVYIGPRLFQRNSMSLKNTDTKSWEKGHKCYIRLPLCFKSSYLCNEQKMLYENEINDNKSLLNDNFNGFFTTIV